MKLKPASKTSFLPKRASSSGIALCFVTATSLFERLQVSDVA